jgi:NtrC-family two-component system response regulator AlgB
VGLESALPGGGGGDDRGTGFRPVMVGDSPVMQALRRDIARLAPWDATVYIHGETGVGKEVVARALHAGSRRHRGPFVAFNAAAFSDELFEGELFGHARGAFTGAHADRQGYVERASGGTLFIDEVGELSLRAQAKLLRFLEEREYNPVGESRSRRANVRVLSATNVDLARRVAEGRFREDLLYRLNDFVLDVPPLRDRGEDVILLASHFLERAARRVSLPVPELRGCACDALRACAWPGNVRQLRREMERLIIRGPAHAVEAGHLSPEVRDTALRERTMLRPWVRSCELERVRAVLARHPTLNGAAAELGISRQALYKKRRRYGL